MGWVRFCICAAALLFVAGCLSPAEGERVVYTSPCSGTYSDILRCAAETGGVDPVAGGEPSDDGVFGCSDACELFVECGLMSPADVVFCTASCLQESDVAELQCFEFFRCEFIRCFSPGPFQ